MGEPRNNAHGLQDLADNTSGHWWAPQPAPTPATPGKSTRAQLADFDPGIETPPTCETAPADTAGCWLTKDQRTILLSHRREAIMGAMVQYQLALVAVLLDELTEEEAGLGSLATIALDVVGLGVERQLGKLLERASESLTMLGTVGRPLMLAASKVPKQTLEGAAMLAVEHGKRAAEQMHLPAGKRQSAKALVDNLKKQAVPMFVALRDGLPADATDEVAAADYLTWDPLTHTQDDYEQLIREQLATVRRLHMFDLGSTTGIDGGIERRRCVWINRPRLRYLIVEVAHRSLDESADRDVELENAVPKDFEASMVAAHRQRWGVEPEERMVWW